MFDDSTEEFFREQERRRRAADRRAAMAKPSMDRDIAMTIVVIAILLILFGHA